MAESVADPVVSGLLEVALQALHAGHLDSAEKSIDEVLLRSPNQVDAFHLKGICCYRRGDDGAAVGWIKQAVDADPEVFAYRFNLGNALRACGRISEAIDAYHRALNLQPEMDVCRKALARLLFEQRDFSEAARHFQLLAVANQRSANDWAMAGEAWLANGDTDRAILALRRATELQPDQSTLWNNLGTAYSRRGYIESGLRAFMRAVEIDPSHIRAISNYANALRDSGRVEEALTQFSTAMEKAPDDPLICSNALFTMLYSDQLRAEEVLLAHRQYERRNVPAETEKPDVWKRQISELSSSVRVGYLSPDFRDHPVAYFIDGLLRNHSGSRVNVYLYATNSSPDAWARRLQSRNAIWRDVSDDTDAELKARIRDDRIDILVDLAGHTAYNRMTAIASRLAPIQIHYLGYPFSTGISSVDYRITDGVIDPLGADCLASEKLLRLSRCYYAYTAPDEVPEISPLPMASKGGACFGVCSNLSKVTPTTLDRWADLLLAIPGSSLRWRAKSFADQMTVRRMLESMESRGVESGRIHLEPWADSEERWAFFSEVDIALDTFPYNQATSTCEALWMGVPTMTISGKSHQARMGASIMQAAGLPEFVAADDCAWVALGRAVIAAPESLSALRATMRDRLKCAPLMDIVGLTREIESLYEQLAMTLRADR